MPVHRAANARLPSSAAAMGEANSRAPQDEQVAMRTAEHDEYQNDDSKGDMKCHGGAGLHAPMNIRHQPADWILHEQKRHDEPVEHLCGGPVLQTIGHEVL